MLDKFYFTLLSQFNSVPSSFLALRDLYRAYSHLHTLRVPSSLREASESRIVPGTSVGWLAGFVDDVSFSLPEIN